MHIARVKIKAGQSEQSYTVVLFSHLLGLMNNFQLPPGFVLIFIATVIRFCDRVDFDRFEFGVSHLKVWCEIL